MVMKFLGPLSSSCLGCGSYSASLALTSVFLILVAAAMRPREQVTRGTLSTADWNFLVLACICSESVQQLK
jgi:hypothetical protein